MLVKKKNFGNLFYVTPFAVKNFIRGIEICFHLANDVAAFANAIIE